MTNLLEQAINCDDGDRAAKIIRDALGIETDDVANQYLPQSDYWPADRYQRARIIGDWIKAEAQYLFGAARAPPIHVLPTNALRTGGVECRGCR